MPKLSLQVSARELHNTLVSPTEEGGPEQAREEENKIIISDSKLKNILPHPPQKYMPLIQTNVWV